MSASEEDFKTAVQRDSPYLWVTWLTKLLVGENSCEWAAWFRGHYQRYEQVPSTFDETTWQLNHTALLNRIRSDLEAKGNSVFMENQNSFALKGHAATLGGNVYALDLNLRERWSTPAKVSGPVLSAPAILSDTLIVATDAKQVHQLSLLDGREEWSFGVGEKVRADIASQGERVYIIDVDGIVHALDAERRIELWTYDSQE